MVYRAPYIWNRSNVQGIISVNATVLDGRILSSCQKGLVISGMPIREVSKGNGRGVYNFHRVIE